MKFDKWTVALAAAGVVSFVSAANAEEKPSSSPVMTALSATTLSGYVDTSAQWNPGTGNQNLPAYKFGGASKADGFNLDVVQVRIEKPLDESEWAAGYRVDLWAGPDANSLGTQSLFGNNSSAQTGDFAIRQAYVALRTPVLNGIDWKIGVFDSIIGYESVESPDNPNYTRSYGHTLEPQTHTGVLASYRFCEAFSASAGVADTTSAAINSRAQNGSSGVTGGPLGSLWNQAFANAGADFTGSDKQAESHKTYMGSVALTAPSTMGFLAGSTVYAGVVNGFNNSAAGSGVGDDQTSYYVGATMATPVTGLRFGAAFDYLDLQRINETAPSGATATANANAWATSLYASYQATEKLSFHARVEYTDAKLENATVTGANDTINLSSKAEIVSTTATIQYDLWKNVLSRVEFRWDHSQDGNMFGGSQIGAPDRENAFMLAANVIYKF
jgi:hypothetical protein